MIKIRYADLPAGLHVRAEASGRHTVIYLLPGLTRAERRAALLRVRRSAGLGYGPRLPASGVAAAIIRDRIGGTVRNGVTALRAHPLLLLPALLIVTSATVVYVVMSAATIRFPQSGAPEPGGATASSALPGARPAARRQPPPAVIRRRPVGRPGGPDTGSAPARGQPSPSPAPPPASGAPSPPPPSEPPSPAPSPSPTCMHLGLLGICLGGTGSPGYQAPSLESRL